MFLSVSLNLSLSLSLSLFFPLSRELINKTLKISAEKQVHPRRHGCQNVPILYKAKYYSTVWMDQVSFIHSSVLGYCESCCYK